MRVEGRREKRSSRIMERGVRRGGVSQRESVGVT